MIKKDAVVSINVSAGFLARVQKMMLAIIAGKNEEDIQKFKKEVEEFTQDNTKEFSEVWIEDLHTLSLLVNEVESTLVKEGHTYEEEITDTPTTETES